MVPKQSNNLLGIIHILCQQPRPWKDRQIGNALNPKFVNCTVLYHVSLLAEEMGRGLKSEKCF